MTTTLQAGPNDKLPYRWDWSVFLNPVDDPWLSGDTIVDATITALPSGLTIETPHISDDGESVRVMLSGGTAGTSYTLTCTISTLAGLTAVSQRTLSIVASPR